LVKGYFALDDLGEFTVKGVAAPMQVHRLGAVGELHTRLDVSRSRGFSRFVGRSDEMRELESALAHARDGNAQVVGIVGDAGLGKSRLCFEFLERCRAHGLMTYETSGVSHGKSIPFLPMLRLFRAFFGITDQDSDATARERIAGRLLLLDEGLRDSLPLLFEFMAVPDLENPGPDIGPEARQRQLFDILRRVTQARGQKETQVMLIEDLHWFDGGSAAFLEPLIEATVGTRALVLLNFRPEYQAPWMGMSFYHQLPIAPLGAEAIRELLDALLGTDASLTGLAKLIHVHTSGNPFFTEEVVQALIESGVLEGTRGDYRLTRAVERLEIPATVNSLLAARIDRLGERDKHALQAAAVIGKEFARPILTPVAELADVDLDEALSILKSGEFIYEQALYPVAEYSFKHPLTQEVALGSQLHERKRGLHARAAQALEESLADKLDESAALIAYHWEEAGENAYAVRWHRRAAEWIVGSDPVQAVRHWQRVRALGIELLADDEVAGHVARACRNVLSLGGWRMGISADEVNEIADQGRALAERVGDRSSQAVILAAHGTRHGVGGRAGLYYDMARESVDVLDDGSPLEERIYTGAMVGYSSWCCGRLAEALAAFERVESLAEGDPNAGLELMGFSAWCWAPQQQSMALGYLGRFDEADEASTTAIQRSRKYGHTENLCFALLTRDLGASARGSLAEGAPDPREGVLEGVEIAEEVGSNYSKVVAQVSLARVQLLVGDFAEAAKMARVGLDMMRERDNALETLTQTLSTLSESLRRLGDHAGAIEAGREAVQTAEQQPCIADGVRAQTDLGLALIEQGGSDPRGEAEACLRGAKRWLEESGARGMQARVDELEQKLASL